MPGIYYNGIDTTFMLRRGNMRYKKKYCNEKKRP